jgi:hypothetical protein
MPRTNWLLFGIGMLGMFTTGAFCLPRASANPWLMLIPISCFVLVMLSSVGWILFNLLRELWIRRVGVPAVGRVIHARSAGYTNNVPTWDVEAELPDGNTTRLIVVRYGPFSPGEPIQLIVNPRNSKHAALPRVSYDF